MILIIFSNLNFSVKNNEAYTFTDACGQAILFLQAGLDTSASTLSFCIYELAINTDIQDKLRLEINEVLQKERGLSNYDSIYEMSYLDKVVSGEPFLYSIIINLFLKENIESKINWLNSATQVEFPLLMLKFFLFKFNFSKENFILFTETLRKYPVAPYIFRVAKQDYKLLNYDFDIPKGTRITIPTQGIHHDENLYPEPDVFNPERFNAETVAKRHAYAYLPFGEGPKMCIGKQNLLRSGNDN